MSGEPPTKSEPLHGTLGRSELIELLRTLNKQRADGCLAIGLDRVQGKLYLETGNVVHAECRSLEGVRAALQTYLFANNQPYNFIPDVKTTKTTMRESLESLLDYFVNFRTRDLAQNVERSAPSQPPESIPNASFLPIGFTTALQQGLARIVGPFGPILLDDCAATAQLNLQKLTTNEAKRLLESLEPELQPSQQNAYKTLAQYLTSQFGL